MKYIFDVDGTLTDVRKEINPKFKQFFIEWTKTHDVYLVTGSDYQKTVEQVGMEIVNSVKSCFNCAGNIQYIYGHEVWRNEIQSIEKLDEYLNELLKTSVYNIKTGNHIEHRIGMVNFSTIGRNCTQAQRDEYYRWDTEHGEREKLRQLIKDKFINLDVHIGGQISLDICMNGCDKSQILNIIDGPYIFFGDRTMVGGNDYNIATKIIERGDIVHQVDGWEETYSILKDL